MGPARKREKLPLELRIPDKVPSARATDTAKIPTKNKYKRTKKLNGNGRVRTRGQKNAGISDSDLDNTNVGFPKKYNEHVAFADRPSLTLEGENDRGGII